MLNYGDKPRGHDDFIERLNKDTSILATLKITTVCLHDGYPTKNNIVDSAIIGDKETITLQAFKECKAGFTCQWDDENNPILILGPVYLSKLDEVTFAKAQNLKKFSIT